MTSAPEKVPSKFRVALAGLGTVGQGVVRLLQKEGPRYREKFGIDLQLVVILDRSYQRKDTSWISSEVIFTESLNDFLKTPSDVIVELIGGMDPADEIIRSSLEGGKSVVTANKLVMARFGTEYLKLAAQTNSYLGFEASVAGGIPIIQVVNHSLSSDRVLRIRGILNGTCNFILSEMANGGSDYQDVLTRAQSMGYAESDPSLDVSGEDARDKLAILSTLCFQAGVSPDQIPTRGITEIMAVDFLYAGRLDATIKLLGVGARTDDGLCLRVGPFLIDNRLALAVFSGVLNAVEITGATLGSVVLSGSGAGEGPTAVSVMADILNAASSEAVSARRWDFGIGQLDKTPNCGNNEQYPFYLRFVVKDRPGIISELANILADRKINIDSVLEERWSDRSNLPFIITVHPTPFSSMQEAVDDMKKLDFNCVDPFVLPILRE